MDVPIDPALLEQDGGDEYSSVYDSERDGQSGSDLVEDELDEDEYDDDEDEYEEEEDGEGHVAPSKADKGKGRARDAPADEFDRLLSAYAADGSGRDNAGGAFDMTVNSLAAQTQDDLEEYDALLTNEAPRSRKARSRRGKGRKVTSIQQASFEVRELFGRANQYWVERRLKDVKECLEEIVRIEPGYREPWTLLAMAAEDEGDDHNWLLFSIMAAHLTSKNEAYAQWVEIGRKSRDMGYNHQAIYCFSHALRLDPEDVDSMWDRAMLLKASGSTRGAIRQFLRVLEIHPNDPGVLREIVPLLHDEEEYEKAARLLKTSLVWYMKNRTSEEAADPDVDDPLIFGYRDLALLADTYERLNQPKAAIWAIKRGVRWLQRRTNEWDWNDVEDDREFDLQRQTRVGWEDDPKMAHLEEMPTYELPIPIRLRLAIARYMNGDVDEAMMHFGIVTDHADPDDIVSLTRCGDTLLKFKKWEEAYDAYARICENEDANEPKVWVKMAQCQINFEDYDGAQETLEAVMEEGAMNARASLLMARVHEAKGEVTEALEWVSKVLALRREESKAEEARVEAERAAMDPEAEGPSRAQLTRQQRAERRARLFATEYERQQEFALAYSTIQDLEDSLDDPDDVQSRLLWLDLTTELIDTFRETRALFPSDHRRKYTGTTIRRHWRRKSGDPEEDFDDEVLRLQNRLRRVQAHEREDTADDDSPDSFRGIAFVNWLSLAIKYAFLLTKNGEHEAAQETLEALESATGFRDDRRQNALRFARAACYLHVGNLDEAISMVRGVWLTHMFQTDSVRLFLAVLGSGPAAHDVFVHNKTVKFAGRQMRAVDAIAKGAKVYLTRTGRPHITGIDPEAESDDDRRAADEFYTPQKRSPFHVALYGFQMLASKSYIPSILYLLDAVELLPTAPILHLALAVAYLGRAQTRQSDNIQHQIIQGLAWMSQYRDHRTSRNPREIEYNFGRFYHQTGLFSFAVEHYQRCLELCTEYRASIGYSQHGALVKAEEGAPPAKVDEPNDLAREAAYNLVQIYATTGNRKLARQVSHQWLSFV